MVDSSIVVHRDDRMTVGEQPVQADIGLKVSRAKPRRRRNPYSPLTRREIVATTAAVIVIGFGSTALLPSILTLRDVDTTQTRIMSPAPIEPPPIEQFRPTDPVPAFRPAVLTGPAPAAPVTNDSTSIAETAPVLDKTGSIPSAQKPSRVGAAEVPGVGKGPPSRVTLTAAEKAAVDRGLKELGTMTAIKAPPRPTPNGFALSEAEKASVERGLRELENAAGQAKQQ